MSIFGNIGSTISSWLAPKKKTTPAIPQPTMQSIPGRVPGEKGVQFTGLGETKKSVFPTPALPSYMQPQGKQQSTIANPGLPAKPVIPQVNPQTPPPVPPTPPTPPVPPTPPIPPVPPENGENPPPGANQDGSGATPTPPVPSDTQKAQTIAEDAYQESLKISPDELSTQEDIDKLIESTKAGYRATSNQPVAMEFITGQLKSIEQRATGLAEPLEAKLARLQASRTSATEASKFALERADKKVSDETGIAQKEREYKQEEAKQKASEELSLKNYQLSEKKFEQDKKEFGLQYALDQKELAQKATEKTAETVALDTSKNQQSSQSIGLVNELLSDPNLKNITGFIQGKLRLGDLDPNNQEALNKWNQLTGLLKLGIRGLIKGQGQISDYEGRILAEASTSLGRNLKDEQVLEAMKKVRGVLKTNSGQSTEVDVKKDGKIIDSGLLGGQEIFDAVSQGYEIIYK